MKCYWCDASVVLRLLTGEPEGLAQGALEIFRRAERGAHRLRLHSVTVAEVVYTLKSYYKVALPEISEALIALLERDGVELAEEEAVLEALRSLPSGSAGFADVLLAGVARRGGDGVATFDRDFRQLDVETLGLE